MKVGFYAGSFDPFTNGHLHVIINSAKLFDKVIVGIGVHPKKTRRFDKELMKQTIEKILLRENLNNVEVVIYNNLSVDVALEYGCTFLVRGVRNGMDYEYEENMASINEEISGLDTIYIRAGKLGNISSSMVMELLRNNKDVSKYLPPEILNLVK
ncbi:MAG: pantetheine-phosphate adenylyltransferase [Clostridia bacterium]|nr:pantetheine-phosphate adenylyltransferase [Clostridia bacterium]